MNIYIYLFFKYMPIYIFIISTDSLWSFDRVKRFKSCTVPLYTGELWSCMHPLVVPPSGRSVYGMAVRLRWWHEMGQVGVLHKYLYLLVHWDLTALSSGVMDRYYARFRGFESNFRPARVFHSFCAVTCYYAYLKQRTKALFQISCLWATQRSFSTCNSFRLQHR